MRKRKRLVAKRKKAKRKGRGKFAGKMAGKMAGKLARKFGRKARKTTKKVVFIVIDGLADTPQKGKTPLSAAKKPNIDWLAANGACGELDLVPKSISKRLYKHVVWSHVANIALLGYNPKRYYAKRGPLEAVGADLPYVEGHLALRCNFATVDKNLSIVDRRAGRESYGLDEIARYINLRVKIGQRFILRRTHGHRAVLVIKKRLSDQITSNDPYKTGVKPKRVEALNERAKSAAELVQSFIDRSHNVIEYHPKNAERLDQGLLPANYLLVREAGNRLVALPNFSRKWRAKAVCIAENGAMKATCMLAGFSAVTVPELSFESSLDFIFSNIESLLPEYGFIYAHIKGPIDEAAHDGDFKKKTKGIEAVDKHLEAFKGFDGILVLTTDHITSCEHKSHMQGPVPVLVYGRKKDRVEKFDEFSVKKGSLKLMKGRQLLKYVFGER